MRLLDLIFGLSEKVAPMRPQDRNELSNEAQEWYQKNTEKHKVFEEIKKQKEQGAKLTEEQEKILSDGLGITPKILGYLEKWGARMIMLIAFPILLKKITDWINGTPKEVEYIDEE